MKASDGKMARLMKVPSWILTAVLVLVIAGLAFIYLVPGYALSTVRSESMVPAINMGDVIITGPVNGNIEPGTIVTYQRGGESITHRVLSIDGRKVTTKGDAVEDADPWLVTLSDVTGVYLFKIPYIGFGLSFIQTKFGWFLAIIIPGALLVGWLVREILKEAFSNVEKTKKRDEAQSQPALKKAFSTAPKTSQRKTEDTYLRDMLRDAFSNVGKTPDIREEEASLRDVLKEALSYAQVNREQKGR